MHPRKTKRPAFNLLPSAIGRNIFGVDVGNLDKIEDESTHTVASDNNPIYHSMLIIWKPLWNKRRLKLVI
ncbi:hypothetical protein OUZ56_030247 [Daphnia magna]|uniref:Uncharacterized protein n=1 Tax=Daphnia magna TaxID=35525 RepID=A0ABQ9ZS03_9CRUS|nr:hypothetical protein OUZ56_030247 [Daphnia magna]